MESLGQEASNDNAERSQALNLWQTAIARSEYQSKEIESLLQVIIYLLLY